MTRAEHRKRMEGVIAEWRRSGIPAAEMAGKAGVSEGTLWRWRKLVGPAPRDTEASISAVQFLPVQILGGPRDSASASGARRPLEVVLSSGTRVMVPEGFSPTSLEQLLPVVIRTC